MSTLNPRVREHAHRVRKWTEINRDLLGGHTSDLAGLCAIASGELWRRLRRDGIPAKLGHAKDGYVHHIVVIVDDHIVDVTATQFEWDHKDVEVRPLRHLLHPWYWKISETFDSDDALHIHQKDTDWVVWQRCKSFMSKGVKLSEHPNTR